MDTSIQERVIDIISENSGHPREKVTLEKNLRDDLNLDSLDSVELCMSVEKEWNLAFSDEEMEKLKDVRSVVELVEAKLKK